MSKQQSGFTLIELIIVIVILGILAATALPKFVDLSGEAETAALDAAKGAFNSTAVIMYAADKTGHTFTQINASVIKDGVSYTAGGGGTNCAGITTTLSGGATATFTSDPTLCTD